MNSRAQVLRPEEEHLAWLFAGYKKGAFQPAFPPDMDPAEFREEFMKYIKTVNMIWILAGRMKGTKNICPMGFAVATNVGHRIFPHVIWFHWASPRNKFECTAKFIQTALDKNFLVFINAGPKYWGFFTKLCDWGILHPLGVVPGWYLEDARASAVEGDGSEAMFFYASP